MASEIERIGAESRRYAERMVERMTEARARREVRDRERAEQAAAEMRRLREELAERAEHEGEDDRPVDTEERIRQGEELSSPAGRQAGEESFRPRGSEVQRLWGGESRGRQEAIAPPSGGGIPARQGCAGESSVPPAEVGELDPREAIARAAAARRRNSIVAPIDDDGDDEAEYYRRNSWLV
ncbi:hypothetical protein [Nocardia sp. X0981]